MPATAAKVPEPQLAAQPASTPTVVPTAAPTVIEVFTREAQNLIAWAVAPLETTIPADVGRNITFIREDLIDEGRAKPVATLAAYRAAYYLCEELQNALQAREQARVAYGYSSAQATANQSTQTQPLTARRSYLMSWPQYEREESQRTAQQMQNTANIVVANEAAKVAWTKQATRQRNALDLRYRAFRSALRE